MPTDAAATSISLFWIYPALLLQRGLELLLCRRNRRILLARGGREFAPGTYPVMVALHTAFLAALLLESYPGRVPWNALTASCLAALLLVTAARYWVIGHLGVLWNTRIVVVPGQPVRRTGPYRWLRHPNYLIIVLEFLILPLLLRAPLTLVLFSLANLAVLRQRIGREEAALRALTDYGTARRQGPEGAGGNRDAGHGPSAKTA